MGMKMKALGNGLKSIGKALTVENTIKGNDGGWSSYLIPRQVNGAGAALIVGGATAFGFVKEGIQGRNRAKLGRISYGDGMLRMTNSFTSGAPEAMMRASKGNYAVFSDMAEEVVASPRLGIIDDYGASPALISALYNMGGR